MSELHVKIGKLLRLERERQGIALDDLSTKLKMSTGNLQHIEAGKLKALPSELYFNLFAKSYAETLGIDYAATVEAIKEDIGQPLEPEGSAKKGKQGDTLQAVTAPRGEAAPSRGGPTPGAKFLRNLVILFGVLIVLFLVFVFMSKLLLSDDNGDPALNWPTEENSGDISGKKQPATDEVGFAAYDWNVPAYKKPSDLQLKLVAEQESWATILADGDTAIFRTLTPGKVYTVSAEYRLRVSIALPALVEVELNGKLVDLRNPVSRRISRVTINQVNLDSLLNPPEPAADTAAGAQGGKPPILAADSITGQYSNHGAPDSGSSEAGKQGADSARTSKSDHNEH